jgi:hypothetical protein
MGACYDCLLSHVCVVNLSLPLARQILFESISLLHFVNSDSVQAARTISFILQAKASAAAQSLPRRNMIS